MFLCYYYTHYIILSIPNVLSKFCPILLLTTWFVLQYMEEDEFSDYLQEQGRARHQEKENQVQARRYAPPQQMDAHNEYKQEQSHSAQRAHNLSDMGSSQPSGSDHSAG